MTDKSQLVSKMNQPTGNGHHGASSANPQGQQKSNKNESRGNRGGRGKSAVGARGREKLSNSGEADNNETSVPLKSTRNTKRGRQVDDMINFEYYRPQPKEYNHFKTHKSVSNYVKEDYVHVSCQFVVNESNQSDLTMIDTCVDWVDVIQVRLPCEELSSCPICLYPPVCPLLPVCGHAMCYSCVLRFQDNCPGGDCPICNRPLVMPDFRPLKTYPRQKFNIEDEIVMKLVSRSKNGKVVCPINETNENDKIPNLSSEWGSKYSHVVSASGIQIFREVLLPQEDELKTQLALLEDIDKESESYIHQALDEVADKKDKCFAEIEPLRTIGSKDPKEYYAGYSSSKRVFFYQCADGQPIFIHPLNSRCLIHEYGTIEACPPEICCKIIAMEYFTQSPELRSRYRYFSHLSLGCSFILCEVDIIPFISETTYEHFRVDLEKRSRTRMVKERKENAYSEKLSKKLAEKEITYRSSASLHKYTEISKPAKEHFKTAENYDMLTVSPSNSSPNNAPLSFADKVCAGAKQSSPWKRTGVDDRMRLCSTSSDVSVGSEACVPSYQHSFSASINDAFASLEVTSPGISSTNGGRGKKKKSKGKTISLTGGARRC